MGLLKYHNGTTWVAIEDGVSDYSAFIQNDNLTGTVDGTNRVFTTTRNFTSISLYVNGVKQNPGAGNDYIVTGANQVTFETGATPQVNAVITADFTTSSSYTVTGTNSFVRKQVVTGAIDGTNKVYTTASPYMPGTLEVFVNGLRQGLPHVVETTPTTGTFTLDEAPLTGDNLEVAYMIASVPSGNADSVDTFHASATPTPNTILPLDATGVMPFAAFPNVGGQVTSSANPGNAGGTRNSVNMGGLLIQWGSTSIIAAGANSEIARGIDFAVPFASSPSFTAFMSTTSGSVVSNFITGNNVTTTGASIYWRNNTASPGIGGGVSWLAIGKAV